MKLVSAVPPYRLSFDFIRIGMLKLSLLRRRLLRARPKAERVFAEYENFLKLSDRPTDRPTDRDAFQRLISFEPSYRLTNGFRHLKATINKSFVLT